MGELSKKFGSKHPTMVTAHGLGPEGVEGEEGTGDQKGRRVDQKRV
ncbi:MAG: hypothetical protein MZV70_66150 [Desulfobacterales bacterium]|nr:hypothetical protein [Desulfobacterales bacterium]